MNEQKSVNIEQIESYIQHLKDGLPSMEQQERDKMRIGDWSPSGIASTQIYHVEQLLQVYKALDAVLDPIRNHNRPMLRKVVEQLKQASGEEWAVGEMLERACILLDMLEMPAESQP